MLQKIGFMEGLDSDTAAELLTGARYRLNVRVLSSDEDNIGAIETVKGNTLVSFTLPAGTNKVIGSYEDKVNFKVYYFVYNSSNNHSILEYNATTNTVATVLQNSVLNFNTSYLITGINVIGGLLYWTDNLNEPKKINIEKGKLHSSGNFTSGYPSPFNGEFIMRIKQPMLMCPTAAYGSDTTKNINQLENKLFQFAVAYVYDDNEISTLSPYSSTPLPSVLCDNTPQPNQNNYINVSVNTGIEIVKRVKIYMRQVTGTEPATGGNVGEFYEIIDIDKTKLNISSNSSYSFKFYNDGVYLPVEVNYANLLFSNVPLASKAQELIKSNRITDGNITEGFDQVDVNTQINLEIGQEIRTNRYSIGGLLRFVNVLSPGMYSAYHNNQPVWLDDNGTYQYGGFDRFTNVASVGLRFNQSFGAGNYGIPVYLVGTPYYGVSEQIALSNNTTQTNGAVDLSSSNTNTLDGTIGGVTQQSGSDAITLQGTLPVPPGYNKNKARFKGHVEQGFSVYSKFRIDNIPPGKYIMRAAAPSVTKQELESGSLNYQNTSCYSLQIGGVTGFECEVEVASNGDVTVRGYDELGGVTSSVTITQSTFNTNGGFNVGETKIADLSNPSPNASAGVVPAIVNPLFGFIVGSVPGQDKSQSYGVYGYLTDHDDATLSGANLVNDTKIPSARVAFNTSNPASPYVSNFVTTPWTSGYALTDHNGFFFFPVYNPLLNPFIDAATPVIPTFQNAQCNGLNLVPTQYTLAGVAWAGGDNPDRGEMVGTILRTTATTDNIRTKVQGNITYNGSQVQGINVAISEHNFATTDVNGAYSAYVYALTNSSVPNHRYVRLIPTLEDTCAATFSPTSLSGDIIPINSIGYNVTNTYSGNDFTIATILGNGADVSLKRGGSYQYVIIYADHGGRLSTSMTNDGLYSALQGNAKYGMKLYIPFYTEENPTTGTIYGGGKPNITMDIYNNAPSWATHYYIGRSVNGSTGRYLQWLADSVTFQDDNGTTVALSANPTRVAIGMGNLAVYDTDHQDSEVEYTFATGDRIRFLRDGPGNFYQKYIDCKIQSFAAGILYIDFNQDFNTFQIAAGVSFEIYNPKKTLTEQVYWEFGECHEIGGPGTATAYHKGDSVDQAIVSYTSTFQVGTNTGFNFATPHGLSVGDKIFVTPATGGYFTGFSGYGTVTSVPSTTQINTQISWGIIVSTGPGTISRAATLSFATGDTYYRTRTVKYNTPAGGSPPKKTILIDDSSFSDFFKSQVSDVGRPNKVDINARRVQLEVDGCWSGVYVPNTLINGLSLVYDNSFFSLEERHGAIQKYYAHGDNLEVYQELKTGQLLTNKVLFTDLSGNSVVGASATIISEDTLQYYQGDFGISKNPESHAAYGPARYFTDVNHGAIIRLSTDGITPISDTYKFHNYVSDTFKAIRNSGLQSRIYGVFDARFNEYVVAVEAVTTDSGGAVIPATTFAFNERFNAWTTHYSYQPEGMCTNGVDIVTFKNGSIYTHNTNSLYNNFYGTQYQSEVWVTGNQESSKKKVFWALSLETAKAWSAYSVLTPNGQDGECLNTSFINKENYLYGAISRDRNTVNKADPLINGNVIRDNTVTVKLRYPGTDYTRMFAVNIWWKPSERSDK